MPDELEPQFAGRDFFEAFGWTVPPAPTSGRRPARHLRRREAAPRPALLLTGDRDMYQCAGDG
jgi:hypothetical protein